MAFVRRRAHWSTQQLAGHFRIDDASHAEFVSLLQESQCEGLLLLVPGKGWELPGRTSLRVGVYRVDRRGNGQVRVRPAYDEVISVRPAESRDAVSGDTVLVSLSRRGRPGRSPEGRVLEVLQRGRRLIRGWFRRGKNTGRVLPENRLLAEQIQIPRGRELDATEGDSVLVRLTEGGRCNVPRGEVVVNLRDEGSLRTDLEIIAAEFDLPGVHDEVAEEEAARLPAVEEEAVETARREDLRHLETFTIDPPDAQDFDDAISLETLPRGRVRLGVHIADVAHYVPSESVLDRTARERGTSIYLPGRVIPMLPERLANSLCSLRPEEDRLAKSVLMTFAPNGGIEGIEVLRSIIHSRRRFTYDEVQGILDRLAADGPGGLSADVAVFGPSLEVMAKLRDQLMAARFRRGALNLDIPALKVVHDEEGEVREIAQETRDEAHSLVEEFMLAANESVARYLEDRGLPTVGRVHPPPDEEKLEVFRDLLKATGFRLRGRGRDIDLQGLIAEVSGTPVSAAIQLALLRTMGHAEYVAGTGLHFALSTESYLHFTSPIRRYPDLVVHQLLDDHFSGRLRKATRRLWWDERLPRLAERASELERRAEEAERAMKQLRLIRYLKPMIGQSMDGWISSVHAFGFFVRVDRLLLEGLVHVATLGDDYYEFEPRRFALKGRRTKRTFRIGDRIRVVLSDLDPDSREIGFQLLQGGK